MPPSPPPLPEVIHRARDYARAGLEAALERLNPDQARICRYYFGWSDADGTPTRRRGSRSLQATMVMLAAEATGEDPARAVPGAVAVELVHNFSLLHDDIADGDEVRRDRPTAWVVFGTGPALLAGDALLIEAGRVLAAVGGTTAAQALAVFGDGLAHLIRTWGGEEPFDRARPQEIRLADYLDICRGKGGALLGTGAVLGTVLCDRPARDGEGLRTAAHHAGTAWQAVNDLENIWGDERLVGKPGFQDLRLRKNTLPVITAMHSGRPGTDQLARLLAEPSPTDGDLRTTADLIEELGGRIATERIAQNHLDQALSVLDTLALPPPVHDDLADLLYFAVTRHIRTR
ncbi:polyprenyl synthetase family protein [Streptomyces triculaminicus]|uniref:polyprenyl synthetase family protein n=1 Tax=Streptomyces triculaminicus TaxID=2816232 RepID=UPI0033D36793